MSGIHHLVGGPAQAASISLSSIIMATTASSIRRRRVQKVADETDTASKVASRHHDNKPAYNIRQKTKRRFCLRDQFMRTNVDMYLLLALFLVVNLWTLHQQLVEASSIPVAASIKGCEESVTLGFPCHVPEGIRDAAIDPIRDGMELEKIYAIFYPV